MVRILALPAVVVLLLLGLLAADQVRQFRGSSATSESVGVALSVQDLVHELQTERGITAAVLGGNSSFRNELGAARRRADARARDVQRRADAGAEPDVAARVRSAVAMMNRLGTIRRTTDNGTAGRQKTFVYFTDRIARLSQLDLNLNDADDPQLRRGVATVQALQDMTEAMAQERAFLNGVFSAGGFGPGEFVQFAEMRAAKDAAQQRFDQLATTSQRASLDFVLDTGAAKVMEAFEQVAVEAADGRAVVVNPQSWWSGLTTVLDDLGQLEQHVSSLIQIRAGEVQQQAAWRLGGLIGLVVLCFIGSAYVASLASRSITRPLAALASEANAVAAERLPEAVHRIQAGDETLTHPRPVPVSGQATAEIRQVATALDRLQSAAYNLAAEQVMQRRQTIESLANLGHRNQNLVRRQLGFITNLEREEADPATLANLFELDHLATRMRRNAASLLVLVSATSPRQWSLSLPVSDVIRAAVSEVEDYRRVLLRRVDEAHVHGSAIESIAHLLAELLENGLTFSPPDTEVEVQGRRMPDGYLIAITDQGVGMSPAETREANTRLQGGDDFVGAPTRYLGHHVVGRLASQTSVRVELIPSPATGVTARVLLSESLLNPARQVGDRAASAETRVVAEAVAPATVEGSPSGPLEASAHLQLTPSAPVPAISPVAPDDGLNAAPTLVPEPSAAAPAETETAGAVMVAPVPVDAGVTRNGLRKRPPRDDRSGISSRATTRVIDLDLVTDDSAEDAASRTDTPATAGFSALRDGLARGHRATEPIDAERASGNGRTVDAKEEE